MSVDLGHRQPYVAMSSQGAAWIDRAQQVLCARFDLDEAAAFEKLVHGAHASRMKLYAFCSVVQELDGERRSKPTSKGVISP